MWCMDSVVVVSSVDGYLKFQVWMFVPQVVTQPGLCNSLRSRPAEKMVGEDEASTKPFTSSLAFE